MEKSALLSVLREILEGGGGGVRKLAENLNISVGTVQRWMELENIPPQYEFDLLKLRGGCGGCAAAIDYSKYTSKQKDQFYTPDATAEYCMGVFFEEIRRRGENPDEFTYIEPSSGEGAFVRACGAQTVISMDIEPRTPEAITCDFLEWRPAAAAAAPLPMVVIGNPPFGLRGHLALRFMNHSYDLGAEYVCFILPQLFESDGKGVPRKRVKGFHLIHSEKLDSEFYGPDKKSVQINTILQIWSRNHQNMEYNISKPTPTGVSIYSVSDGGTVSTTRNKKMIGNCDIYIPSTCFGRENMRFYASFDELPGKKGYGLVFQDKTVLERLHEINPHNYAFLSTNSAYNLRSSQISAMFSACAGAGAPPPK